MKVHRGIEEFERPGSPFVLTIGTFDGVHEGHKAILERLFASAKELEGESAMLTFFPHPRMVLHPDSDVRLLTTLDEKKSLLEEQGLDHLIVQPFDKAFASLDPKRYIREVLMEGLGVSKLVIGYDHRFGKGREGDIDTLRDYAGEFGYEVEEIPAHLVDDVDVSSTKIRNALYEGDVEMAERYLGQAYSLTGRVEKGDGIGSELGYPTANIEVPETYKLIPAYGVYAVEVLKKGEAFPGMLNIGVTPTLHEKEEASIEVHLFGVSGELYGEELTVRFRSRIRDEERFEGEDDLKARLRKDEEEARRVLGVQS